MTAGIENGIPIPQIGPGTEVQGPIIGQAPVAVDSGPQYIGMQPCMQTEVQQVYPPVTRLVLPSNEVTDVNLQAPNPVPTPGEALQTLSTGLELAETEGVTEKFDFINTTTEALQKAADFNIRDADAWQRFRKNPAVVKLGISSSSQVKRLSLPVLHRRVIDYMGRIGIGVSEAEKHEIQERFRVQDQQRRRGSMESYAQHGVLTLRDAAEANVAVTTSSDYSEISDIQLEDITAAQVRGYEISKEADTARLFNGANGFFKVVAERPFEAMNRAENLPRAEVENRLKHSLFLVVGSDKLTMSRRDTNRAGEDIVNRSIHPKDIDYVLVDSSNAAAAEEVYANSPTKVVEVGTKEVVLTEFGKAYTVPDYEGAVAEIVEREGPVWGHIARLPEDSYPEPATI